MTADTSKFMVKRRAALYVKRAIITLSIIGLLTAFAPFSPYSAAYTITAQNDAGDVYTAVNAAGHTLTFTIYDVDGFIFGVGQRVTVTTLEGRLDILTY